MDFFYDQDWLNREPPYAVILIAVSILSISVLGTVLLIKRRRKEQ